MSVAFVHELELLKAAGYKEIDLRLNSKGGDVTEGVAMYNAMLRCSMVINVYVDGMAGSMASVLAFSGDKLFVSRYGRIMIHKPSGGAWGNSDQLRTMADYIDSIEADMEEIYCKRTGLSKEEVKAHFLNGKDNVYTAQMAMDAGLIDGIFDGEEMDIDDSNELDADTVYMAFQAKIEAKLISQNMNTIQMELTPEMVGMLGVTASADAGSVTAAIKQLSAKAKQSDGFKSEVQTLKAAAVQKDVTALLTTALGEKKITKQQHDVFAEQYAGRPEDLKALLGTFNVFGSVTNQLNTQERSGVRTPEVLALVNKGWTALMQSGEMATLKQLDKEAYSDMYEARFGNKPVL